MCRRNGVLSSSPERQWRQRFGSRVVASSGCKRSKSTSVLIVAASVAFLCCIFNIVRLHSSATTVRSNQWAKGSEPSGEGGVGWDRSTEGGSAIIAAAPTWQPTTATYAPTSWGPTTATYSPTAQTATKAQGSLISNQQNDQSGVLHVDERADAHPKIACFIYSNDMNNTSMTPLGKGTSCNVGIRLLFPPNKKDPKPSIPLEAKPYRGDDANVTDDENEYIETETCKFPTEHATALPPPTCNDIHSLGFDSNMFQKEKGPSQRASIKYVTMGGAKCVWKVKSVDDNQQRETFIFKSQKDSRFLKRNFWEQSTLDALISGRVGNAQLSELVSSEGTRNYHTSWNYILPVYHYCGLSNIVPYADGTLEEYILQYAEENEYLLHPRDTLRLALQVARGLHQAQLYWKGRATFVHADINPSQFLVFTPPSNFGDSNMEKNKTLPILQINDFNQGRFLTRSTITNETCPYKTCSKNLRGNRYHTPERFIGCMDQSEGIDTWSLGGVFFYLLTNGFDPYYDDRSYHKIIKAGKQPHIPRRRDLDHPAYDALKDVMKKCMALELHDRPSALEVVQMLEEKMKEIGMRVGVPY